uniref:Uncharacterized protein n=1 Tax=Arundo donax TaxID=35708 RepID=A0A0A9HB00_ARUDO
MQLRKMMQIVSCFSCGRCWILVIYSGIKISVC